MLGLIIGTVVVIGAIKAIRRAHCGWHHQQGYGFCHGPGAHFAGQHGGWHARGRGGPRWMLRWLFERLETTPGQEKAIVAALEELRSGRGSVREEAKQTRADIARAVASGVVDDATLEETFARHDRLLAHTRVSFVEALKKTTDALDERQRRELAKILEGRAWFGSRWDSSDVWA